MSKKQQNAEALRAARKEAGFTVTEAAFHMGISANYLQMLESSMREIGDAVTAKAARLYGVTFEKLHGDINRPAIESGAA